MADGWRMAPFNLSRGRESVVSLAIANDTLAEIAGWEKWAGKYQGCGVIDVYQDTTVPGGNPASAGLLPPEYDMGAASISDHGIIVDSTNVYSIDRNGTLKTIDQLPPALKGSSSNGGTGAIPAGHIPQVRCSRCVLVWSYLCVFWVVLY